MSYNAVPTVLTGDVWTASQHNLYIRDNFEELWPYTDAGDIAISTSNSTLDRFPIGTANQILHVKDDLSVFEWYTPDPLRGLMLARTTSQSLTDEKWEDVVWNSEIYDSDSMWSSGSDFQFPVTGIYRLSGNVTWSANNTGFRVVAINGSSRIYLDARKTLEAGVQYTSFSYIGKFTSGINYTIQMYHDTAGASLSTSYMKFSYFYLGESLV